MSKYLPYRHPFRFSLSGNKLVTFMAKVIAAKETVALKLTADDVRRSIELGGVGNTQTCSMAVCAKCQAGAFPHQVEGYIDWTYRRAYVVSKTRADGTPSECVIYRHDDDVAKLNDTKGGQKKLLASLISDGDLVIRLRPLAKKRRYAITRRGTGKKCRAGVIRLRGASLRFAVGQLGGVPA